MTIKLIRNVFDRVCLSVGRTTLKRMSVFSYNLANIQIVD